MAKSNAMSEPVRHAWSTATDSKSGGLTNIEESGYDGGSSYSGGHGSSSSFQLMGVGEAEDLVEGIRGFDVEEIG